MKTITITEDAYDVIKNMKSEDESFSRFFIRLSSDKNMRLRKLFGAMKVSEKESKAFISELEKEREKFSRELEENMNDRARHFCDN